MSLQSDNDVDVPDEEIEALGKAAWALERLPELEAEVYRRQMEGERRRLSVHGDEIRERCKSLRHYIAEAWPVIEPTTPYVYGWHHDAVSEHLEAVTRGEIQRLQINMPPGCMKSLIASVLFETWEWGPAGKPGLRYLTTSYKADYAKRDSGKHRDLVLSEWYQTLWPHIVLENDNAANFQNTFKGGRRAVPFQSLTAGRGNRLVIDDPHSTEQVESKTQLLRARRIFRESATSRLNDPARDAIIVIMHRLHNQDVCAVIEELGLPYTKLILPMEYEPKSVVYSKYYKDPREEKGELLFPDFIPRETVEKNKIELGSHAYATQYQQQASPREGTLFKRHWFKIVDAVPARVRARVRRWDLASSEEAGDWTAGVRMVASLDGEYYIEDVMRFRELGAHVHATIKTTSVTDQTWGVCHVVVPQDPGQAGKDQVAAYIKENAGIRISAERETGSKITRAEPFAAQCEAGNVYLVRGAWNEAFIDELCKINPATINAIETDQMDAAAGAFNKLLSLKGFQATQEMVDEVNRIGRMQQMMRRPT
jgi:predicted phage terminase large subunit-like protein